LKEQIYTLLLLQEIDRDIVREENKQKKLPAKIHEIENIKASIEQKLNVEKENLKELQSKIKRKEMDAKALSTKIEKHQNELYGGKTSDIKELKQLQKAIELLKEDRDDIEEELLVLMDEEDYIKLNLNKANEELTKANYQLQQKKEEVDRLEIEIIKNIEDKRHQRTGMADRISDNDLLKRYHMLWDEKEGEVVVEIDGQTCNGCNLSLPSDIIYHLQKDDMLITCPNCNRILVWKDR
jgi:hypothetical protein